MGNNCCRDGYSYSDYSDESDNEVQKTDKKFKQAGQGYTLQQDGQQQPSASKQQVQPRAMSSPEQKIPTRPDVNAIAEAAERRMGQSKSTAQQLTPFQKIVRMEAKKQLEEEQRKLAQQIDQVHTKDTDATNSSNQNEPKVLYTCELFDEDVALPKSQMMDTIEECLLEQLNDAEADKCATAIYIIYTLNKEEIRKEAIETIQKYLQNIINNPNEPKYRRIRVSNKVFKEKVANCKGALAFLDAVGFREERAEEVFLVMDTIDVNHIAQLQKALMEGKSISVRVFRDRKVFLIDPNKPVPRPDIPDDFFMRTAEEIRREQQQRTETLEKMTTLRTSKMREMDAAKEKLGQTNYKYTYIRIRFPNNYVIQGIFNVFEKLSAVRDFISKHLAFSHGTFILTGPPTNGGTKQFGAEDSTLLDLGLVPAALIFFVWDDETKAQLARAGDPVPYLTKEIEESAEIIQ